jgi:hypothetical protein
MLATAMGGLVLLTCGLASSPITARGAATSLPDRVGSWTRPFEEGGLATSRCVKNPSGRIICKPVGVAQAIMPDGRIFYLNGAEGSENIQYGVASEGAPEIRNSRARIMDLRDGIARWTVPSPEDGGGRNPNIKPGDTCPTSDPVGAAGVPGRPGDGLVGSVVGGSATGLGTGIEHDPSCTPDSGVSHTQTDMFCSDTVSLVDDRIMIIGGSSAYNEPGNGLDRDHGYPYDLGLVELEGLRNVRIFDPYSARFNEAAPMKYGRWYPGAVTLSDGRVIVMSGVTKLVKNTQMSQIRRSETYDPAANAWTENYTGPSSENSLPLYPRLFLTPNNKVFYGGSGEMWGPMGEAADQALFAVQQFFNLASKRWEILGLNPLGAQSSPFSVALPMRPPYDKLTLLTYGGTLGSPPGSWLAVAFAQLTTIDTSGKVANTRTADLHHARWFPAGVALPDGKVVALNGSDRDQLMTPGVEVGVRTPELYDPATGTWTDMAASGRERSYHSAAILLPDGRVLSGGHAPTPSLYGAHHTLIPGVTENNDKDPSFEVWSPPYLYYGPRPRITHSPRAVTWGSTFTITVDDPSSIGTVVAMRTPAQQHAHDSGARTVELSFTQTGAHTLEVTAPPTGVVAPPGSYYLFVNRHNPKGLTPSMARIVFIGDRSEAGEAVQPMADDAPPSDGGSATPVEDSSYQHQVLGPTGGRIDDAAGSQARRALAQYEDRHPRLDVSRLAALVRDNRAPAAFLTAGLLVVLVLRRPVARPGVGPGAGHRRAPTVRGVRHRARRDP